METIIGYWTAGGPLMWPLALLSLATWYWMTSLHEKLRASGAGPSEIEPLLERLAGRGSGLEGARAWVAGSPGAVSRVVDHLMRGEMTPEVVRGRASEAIAAEVGPVERELTVLRAMVAAAPLVSSVKLLALVAFCKIPEGFPLPSPSRKELSSLTPRASASLSARKGSRLNTASSSKLRETGTVAMPV